MISLPTEWKFVSVGEIARVIRGASPRPKGDPRFYGGNVPRLMGTDVTRDGKYVIPRIDFLTEEGAKLSRPVPKGTLTVVCSGLVGVPSFLAVDACIHDGFLALENISDDCDKEFLYYTFLHMRDQLDVAATHGGIFTNLTTDILRAFEFPLPPLPEQRAIAAILSTWDEAITLTAALIDALKRRKAALMSLLLTGKVRFAEFVRSDETQETEFGEIPSEWKYSPISNIAVSISERNADGSELPVLSCTKYDGLVDSLTYFGRQIFSDDLSTYKIVRSGQFAYATNHIEEGSIGYQDLYDAALISPMYTIFETTNEVHDPFLYAVLKTELYRTIFEKNTSASVDRRGSLRWSQFSRIKVPLPQVDEQIAISNTLETAQEMIDSYEHLRESLQTQKRGLMQQLLTGAVRVKVKD